LPIRKERRRIVKAVAITGGYNVASTRFRIRQYIPYMVNYGIRMEEFMPSIDHRYPPQKKILRFTWFLSAFFSRILGVLKTYQYDLTILQRELISTIISLEPFLKKPFVFDVDDAIWLHSRWNSALRIAKLSAGVIAGNNYIANYFSKHASRIWVVPTAIDTKRWKPSNILNNNEFFTIDWTGGSSAFSELYRIEKAIHFFLKVHSDAKLRIIADRPPVFNYIPSGKIEFIRWNPDREVQSLQGIDVGLMPLKDSEWNRGKCAYKLFLYMSLAKPAIASPIGANEEILAKKEIGFSAKSISDWKDALEWIYRNHDKAIQLGINGRSVVESKYSIQKVVPYLVEAIKQVANNYV